MVTFFQMTIGELVKDVLDKKKISQVDLAQRIGLTPAQVSRIISGERGTSIDTLILIADALNINRETMLRVAAGSSATTPTIDEETEELNQMVETLSPDKRPIARLILKALLEGPPQVPAPAAKRSTAKGKA